MATKVNLPQINRGDTTPYIFRWNDGTGPLDMRGKTVIMTFKVSEHQDDADAHLTKTITYAMDDVDAENGVTAFQLETSETLLLVSSITYKYAVRVITPSGPEDQEITYFCGDVMVEDA